MPLLYDQTAYFGTVEQDKLKALLVLEADRMQNALINAEQLTSEARSDFRLQGENNRLPPESRCDACCVSKQGLWVAVGGTKADVQKFTVEQVQRLLQLLQPQ